MAPCGTVQFEPMQTQAWCRTGMAAGGASVVSDVGVEDMLIDVTSPAASAKGRVGKMAGRTSGVAGIIEAVVAHLGAHTTTEIRHGWVISIEQEH